MKLLGRAVSWLVRRIPSHYRGSALDRFSPEDQQAIIANRFRSGL